MSDKLTLSETWTKCLKMWKWVAKNCEGDLSIAELKEKWLKDHHIKDLEFNCFFCQYNKNQQTSEEYYRTINCKKCPAKLISPQFHCENYPLYGWNNYPKAFYKKILELHKLYLKSIK